MGAVISTMTKRDKIKGVIDAYDRQYREHYGEPYLANHRDPYETYCALKRLNLDTCTEKDVEAAIGNPTWTKLECDHCGKDSPALTTFEGEYGSFSVCEACLTNAASGITAQSSNPTEDHA